MTSGRSLMTAVRKGVTPAPFFAWSVAAASAFPSRSSAQAAWPPPQATSSAVVPRSVVAAPSTVGDSRSAATTLACPCFAA